LNLVLQLELKILLSISCLFSMPRCPRCSKNFQDMSRVMNHMNQPSSSCLSYYEEISHANALQVPNSNLNILAGNGPQSLHQKLTDVPNDLMDVATDFDSPIMDIDNTDTLPATWTSAPFLEMYPGAAQTFGRAPTFMDVFDADPHAPKRKQHPYYPFASREEWQLASFLLCSDLSMNAIDKFLKLGLVSSTLPFFI